MQGTEMVAEIAQMNMTAVMSSRHAEFSKGATSVNFQG